MLGKASKPRVQTRRTEKSQLMLFCSDLQEAEYHHFNSDLV